MKKRYYVTVPVCGAVSITVEAESEEEAIDIACVATEEYLGKASFDDDEAAELVELNAYESVGRGNVTYLTYNEATAEEAE